ncbi:copper homeostasis protein CutC [Sanguibacter sp. HDW7]|uniref:copper homeostasis protein CutC n=1 Tax=Sanguibacter sp. HDW7 TaxID=2714931 RepID=UPI00140DAE5D|nr:copper homeostasis protein CutC [Sanguibacter sp. HDW7]QIK84501.1 copper homeostasis protein CutC [Sanguibacter sp. HDW7]
MENFVGRPTAAVEIAVQDAVGARVAREAGADRVELCGALAATGGLTPSLGTIETVVAVGLPVHVLVRPRTGGFQHDADELALMEVDIRHAVRAGASGVVVGVLDAHGVVDRDAVARLRDAADGREVTFHRALDVVTDRLAALHVLADLGITRVLTSGGAARTILGIDELAAMVREGTGVQIMAGGGLRAQDVAPLLVVGVDAVHLSASVERDDRGPAGPGGGAGGAYLVTDPDRVREVVRAAHP